MDEIGLDISKDFCGKIHLNFDGADKFSAYLADRIAGNFEITKHAHQEELWRQRIDNYKKYSTDS